MPMLDRCAIMAGISATGTAFALGGYATDSAGAAYVRAVAAPLEPPVPTPSADIYGEVTGEPFPIPAVKLTGLDPTYLRTTVRYPGTEEPGTIVVDWLRAAISSRCRPAEARCATGSALGVKE